jgi:hypothetical protein
MGVVSAYAFSFMSKYLHQSCGPKPMTRVDINDNNQSSNTCIHSWQMDWKQSGTMKEREKNRPFIFIFSRKCICNHIVFSFLVNYLIIISKELSHPFLFLWGGNVLFQKILEALMICLNLEAFSQ